MLKTKLERIESRIEEQVQYSRRTSLRFNNVSAQVGKNGETIKPIDTDTLGLNICKDKLNVELTPIDIGRSHPIDEIRDGKISITVRFLSYRQTTCIQQQTKTEGKST